MSLSLLQEKCDISADGLFGPGTINAAARYYNLTNLEAAHFFGQVGHETGNFKAFSENLNYSAKALDSVFGKYFVRAGRDSEEYARQPERIANIVYANRMGNGNEVSGDGWKYRGRGALQLTGRNNYEAFAKSLGNDNIIENPECVGEEFAFESAMFFFKQNNLWEICNEGMNDAIIEKLTKRINGGTHGLADRTEKTKKYYGYVTRK